MDKDCKAILRAQLEAEIHNKKQCSYESYQCSHLTVDGSKFCLKHILNDKNAPFKQCNFIYQNNGKRCYLPAPKGDKKDYGYCNEHALKATLSRNKQNSKNSAPLSAESLLTQLSHFVKKPRNKNVSSSSYMSDEEKNHTDDIGEIKVIRTIDPFVDIDAHTVYNEQCNEILDMCSESESDVEPSTFATVWHDENADSSDNESIDSEDEDPLKHANVYTAEEVCSLTRDKLVRLQSLYIDEYKHLRYLLKERRRKYIHSLKREKETCCNIFNQVRDNPKEQRLYKKLKQYNKYHKAYGEEAILEKRLHDLRMKITEGVTVKSANFTRCQFTEGGVKCGERALPMAKHCRRHILEDSNQVLFKACGKVNADVECNTPVEAIFDDSTCKLHMDIPPIRSYNHPRREIDSDHDEDALDIPTDYTMSTSDSVKTEMIDYSLPSLTKMETLPSLLFEDSAESLSSTLQYSTSEFTEDFTEQSSIDIGKHNGTDIDVNINENDKEEIAESEIHANNTHTPSGPADANDVPESTLQADMSQSQVEERTIFQNLNVQNEPNDIKFVVEEFNSEDSRINIEETNRANLEIEASRSEDKQQENATGAFDEETNSQSESIPMNGVSKETEEKMECE